MRRRSSIALLAVVAGALTLLPPIAAAQPAEPRHEVSLPIAPRLQWNSNFGYCGETSFISAGMRFGQYTSQWTARHLAAPHVKEWHAASQLLLGVNDGRAARRMKLSAEPFAGRRDASAQQFLSWVTDELLAGHVPIIGVFNNVTRLGEPPRLADPTYDHIVPVLALGSRRPLGPLSGYRASDTLTLSDNGLYGRRARRRFLFTYRFGSFPRTRRQADAPHGPLYSLKSTPPNYGTSVLGVRDPTGVTVPVRLTSSARGEGRENRRRLRRPPRAFGIRLTAHAKLPDRDRAYDVYVYRSFDDVPIRDFNSRSGEAIRHWHIPAGHGRRWTNRIHTRSNRTRIFRAVPSDAP